jgi:2-keto-4-pentenoate hydratase/2-oxohepta-3-ene-1,7-dioic acid hydratase in catechol pathway
VIIGKGGKDISAADAPGHIWGYTILNDVSARDAQMREMPGQLGPAKGKDFDTGNILGPWLVTRDEIQDPYNLKMTAKVNGAQVTDANSGEIYHRIETMIERISFDETLHAGEFIGLGTVGDGCGLEHGRFLKPGDELELSIEGLGSLVNRIGSPGARAA